MSQIYKQNTGGGGTGIITINGDTGSITGSTVTIYADNAAINSGQSVKFVNSGTISTLDVTDSNANTIIGLGAGKLGQTYSSNTSLGYFSLSDLRTGAQDNTAVGNLALEQLLTGTNNSSVGANSLNVLSTGSNNIAFGSGAGDQYTGSESSNIVISNTGITGDNNITRIGTQGSGTGQQNKCFIAGIIGNTVSNQEFVTINSSTGQLGVTPSGGGFTPVNWSVQLSTNQSNVTGNNTQYQIPYDSVLLDSASAYSTGTHLYTIPATGVYSMTINTFLFGGTSASTQYLSWLSVNGAAYPGLRFVDLNPGSLGLSANSEFIYSATYLKSFTVGDTIGIFIDVIGGASNDVGAGGGSVGGCMFTGFRVA
jgi:hypothetical protein